MTTAEGQNTEEPRQIIFQQNRKKKKILKKWKELGIS